MLASLCLLIPAGLAHAAEPPVQDRFALWDPATPFPSRKDLPYPKGATDCVVHRASADGYGFLHDCALVEHKGTLLAAWYNCPRGEMVGESVIRGRRSTDGGRTWSNVEVIAADRERRGIMYVPVALVSHGGTLHAFITNMKDGPDRVHACEAFVLDEKTNAWISRGLIAGPFIANCAPQRLADGNFIMAGRMAEQLGQKPTIPAVAISQGEELAKPWTLVRLLPDGELPGGLRLGCPETTVIVDGPELTCACPPRERQFPGLLQSRSRPHLVPAARAQLPDRSLQDLRRETQHRPSVTSSATSRAASGATCWPSRSADPARRLCPECGSCATGPAPS